jgi:hypothetical protein
MDLARRAFWLAIVVVLVAAGCSEERAEPELGLPALTLHVCLRTEPTGEGPCSDEALATACPPQQARDACRQEALAQIAAYDRYEPPADEGIGGGGILITVLATAGVLGVLGIVLTRRNRRRNRAAFEAALPALGAAGFRVTDVAVPLSASAPRVRESYERSRRVLRGDGEPTLWLYETDMLGTDVNGLPPIRWAAADVPAEAATDQAALASVLHDLVDPDGPFVGAWLGEGQLVLWTRVPLRRSRTRPAPMSLLELAELHAAMVESLRVSAST